VKDDVREEEDCLTIASLDSADVSSEFLVPPGDRVEGDNLLACERRSS
jgi:hypothetical protein